MLETLIRRFFTEGAAIFHLPGGRTIATGAGAPEVVVRLRDMKTALRIALKPSLALGEAYVDGGLIIQSGDIYALVDLIGRNLVNRPRTPVGPWRRLVKRLVQANNRFASRRNAAHHYDLTVDFYRCFLDEDLQYSCAYFEQAGMTLEQAQAAKKRLIMNKLLLRPGMSVLDIGCGWGGLGISLARDAGARVLGVTVSGEQQAVAAQRAQAAGLQERTQFRVEDFRDVKGSFDRIVSVGMFEHVGAPNYEAYFKAIAALLPDDGVALVHSIGRKDEPNDTQPWIAKYIFPGGYIPALSEVLAAVEKSGLWVTDIEVLRLHYAETLQAWRKRFHQRRAYVADLYDERFCRMWEFYLAVSEMSFRWAGHMVFQLQLAKRIDAVPLTRRSCDPRMAAADQE